MPHRARSQREYLVEDLAQICRYFPGARLIETPGTPFDIRPAARHKNTAKLHGTTKRTKHTGDKKIAIQAALTPDRQRFARLAKDGLFFHGACIPCTGDNP